MAVYEGGRFISGVSVTVDGAPLPEGYEVKIFSSSGFEWTYEGDGPRQLALALLLHHTGNPDDALRQTEGFMEAVVANLDNSWQITTEFIDGALASIGGSCRS